MQRRGMPFHVDNAVALQMAAARVGRYKAQPRLQPEPLAFTREAVIDALCVAPAPVCQQWVMLSLASVAGLARWLHGTGQPLTRAHAFDAETRHRYIQRCKDLNKASSRTYEIRLDLIAETLNGVTISALPRAVTHVDQCPVEPLTETEEADLWVWSLGLRPTSRLHRVQGSLVLGLGVGLLRTTKYVVRADDVIVNSRGVHVRTFSDRTGEARLVTCRRDWEDRLIALKERTPGHHFLMSPARSDYKALSTVDESLRLAQKCSPPAPFNNIRLRNTWLCYHLEQGTPLKVLMWAADMVEVNHLNALLPFVADVPAEWAQEDLRGPE